MSLEHHPAGSDIGTSEAPDDNDYWHALIDERCAAEFMGLSVRTLQGLRYRGGGPRFVRISSRCTKYRRTDLRAWAEARLRTSTSDMGAPSE